MNPILLPGEHLLDITHILSLLVPQGRTQIPKLFKAVLPPPSHTGLGKGSLMVSPWRKSSRRKSSRRRMCPSPLLLPALSFPHVKGLKNWLIHGRDKITEHLDNVKHNKLCSSAVNHFGIIHYVKIYRFPYCKG